MSRHIKMFISCTWKCNPDACKKKVKFFNQHGLKHEFIEPYNDELSIINGENETYLEKKMRQSDCLLILSGVDEVCEVWLDKEIQLAVKYAIPIVAISPWSQKEPHALIRSKAHKIVGWHGKLITDAIKDLIPG